MSSLGNKDIMAQNISYYMKKHGIDRNKLCDDLGFKYMTVSDWINAKTYPRIDKIEKLANYFNIQKADLVEEHFEADSFDYQKDNISKLGELIITYRKQHELSIGEFAQKAKLSKSYITMIEKGENPKTKKPITPTLETLKYIANAMNMELQELQHKLNGKQNIAILNKVTTTTAQLKEPRQEKVLHFAQDQLKEQQQHEHDNVITLADHIEDTYEEYTHNVGFIGRASAGTGFDLCSQDAPDPISLPTSIIPKAPFDYVIQVDGNSMEPLFEDGEYIFIKETPDVLNGQIAIVDINDERYVKKIYYEQDHIRLVSLNKNYDDIYYYPQEDTDNYIQIIGKVVM